jgi:hypothetical protein
MEGVSTLASIAVPNASRRLGVTSVRVDVRAMP